MNIVLINKIRVIIGRNFILKEFRFFILNLVVIFVNNIEIMFINFLGGNKN